MKDKIISYQYEKEDRCPDKEYEHYEVLDEHIVRCDNCKLDLITILTVKESDRESKTKAVCPICKDSSFYYNTKGEIYLSPIEENNLCIGDVKTSMTDGKFTNIVGVVINGKT